MNDAKKLSRVFISYRRDDSAGITGRIYDRLIQRFGREAIFKDVDSIPLGTNFKHYIDSVIAQCGVVLVVIGDKWETITDKQDNRLLHKQRDFVRLEIESALQRDIPIIPIFVQNASMPTEDNLPPSLAELTYRNGMEIGHDPHFHTDINRLISHLEVLLSEQSSSGPADTTPLDRFNKTLKTMSANTKARRKFSPLIFGVLTVLLFSFALGIGGALLTEILLDRKGFSGPLPFIVFVVVVISTFTACAFKLRIWGQNHKSSKGHLRRN